MTSKLNPYLSFPGTAREAMTFYQEVLGGTLEVTSFADAGGGDAPAPDGVMHARLETPAGFTLMASDMPPGMDHTPGNNLAVSLSGDDETEVRGYWDKLSSGSTVVMPLEKQVWNDVFGMCTDRFGTTWMVNISESAG